jgi:hypothetical protein
MAYTPEEEAKLKAYPQKSPEELAEELGKSKRSVIAKLSKLGVYVRPARVTKAGDPIISKAELVAEIEQKLEAEFPTLVKAGKEDLRALLERL